MICDPSCWFSVSQQARAGRVRTAPLVIIAGIAVGAFSLANLMSRGGQRVPPPVIALTDDELANQTKAQEREEVNSQGMRLVRVRPNRFLMGSPNELRMAPDDERPRREVALTRGFALGKHEVTRGQFRAFVEATGYQTEAERSGQGSFGHDAATGRLERRPDYTWRKVSFTQADSHPVVCVSWNDAMAFCAWLSKTEGKRYDLPTEAEWECACRAGTPPRFGGNDPFESLADIGNCADLQLKSAFPHWERTLRVEDGYVFTAPIGQYYPNGWGLHDMQGNAWEWCADWYARDYYTQRDAAADPQGPRQGVERVLRGGAWSASPGLCRPAARARHVPDYASDSVGFRVCQRD